LRGQIYFRLFLYSGIVYNDISGFTRLLFGSGLRLLVFDWR